MDKLYSLEECDTLIKYGDPAEKRLAKQLADTMRENERLKERWDRHLIVGPGEMVCINEDCPNHRNKHPEISAAASNENAALRSDNGLDGQIPLDDSVAARRIGRKLEKSVKHGDDCYCGICYVAFKKRIKESEKTGMEKPWDSFDYNAKDETPIKHSGVKE